MVPVQTPDDPYDVKFRESFNDAIRTMVAELEMQMYARSIGSEVKTVSLWWSWPKNPWEHLKLWINEKLGRRVFRTIRYESKEQTAKVRFDAMAILKDANPLYENERSVIVYRTKELR
jgi:hypothetical protein